MDDLETTMTADLCALLRGDRAAPPTSTDREVQSRYREHAVYHGVGPLLARRMSQSSRDDGYPARELKDESAIELLRKHELVRVLEALARAGLATLLLKGTALAYSLYPAPALRPRADTDVLIRSAHRQRVAQALARLGYQPPNAISGDFVKYQCGYLKRDRCCVEHVLDVHWRISNAQLFSRTSHFEELMSRSVAIPALGAHARGLSRVDALLLACMHRVHHFNTPYRVEGMQSRGRERLIWLYDIHLLVSAMKPAELVEFARLANDKGVRAVCNDGLRTSQRCFGTPLPEEALCLLATSGRREASAAHLRAGNVRRLLIELRALPRWRDRVALLSEHLFPPSEYMLKKYAVTSRAWLPKLYLQRGIQGAWKRIQTR